MGDYYERLVNMELGRRASGWYGQKDMFPTYEELKSIKQRYQTAEEMAAQIVLAKHAACMRKMCAESDEHDYWIDVPVHMQGLPSYDAIKVMNVIIKRLHFMGYENVMPIDAFTISVSLPQRP